MKNALSIIAIILLLVADLQASDPELHYPGAAAAASASAHASLAPEEGAAASSAATSPADNNCRRFVRSLASVMSQHWPSYCSSLEPPIEQEVHGSLRVAFAWLLNYYKYHYPCESLPKEYTHVELFLDCGKEIGPFTAARLSAGAFSADQFAVHLPRIERMRVLHLSLDVGGRSLTKWHGIDVGWTFPHHTDPTPLPANAVAPEDEPYSQKLRLLRRSVRNAWGVEGIGGWLGSGITEFRTLLQMARDSITPFSDLDPKTSHDPKANEAAFILGTHEESEERHGEVLHTEQFGSVKVYSAPRYHIISELRPVFAQQLESLEGGYVSSAEHYPAPLGNDAQCAIVDSVCHYVRIHNEARPYLESLGLLTPQQSLESQAFEIHAARVVRDLNELLEREQKWIDDAIASSHGTNDSASAGAACA